MTAESSTEGNLPVGVRLGRARADRASVGKMIIVRARLSCPVLMSGIVLRRSEELQEAHCLDLLVAHVAIQILLWPQLTIYDLFGKCTPNSIQRNVLSPNSSSAFGLEHCLRTSNIALQQAVHGKGTNVFRFSFFSILRNATVASASSHRRIFIEGL